MQLRTFTRWWNSTLAPRHVRVQDLVSDVAPGVLPNVLLEILTDAPEGRCCNPIAHVSSAHDLTTPAACCSLKYSKKPTLRFHFIENLASFLKEVAKCDVKLVNIGAEGISRVPRVLTVIEICIQAD